jgi:hypothetical protein
MDPTSVPGFSTNKAIATLIPIALIVINQLFGTTLSLTPDQVNAITIVLGLLTPLVAYFVPNRVNSDQAAKIVAATANDPKVQAKAAAITQSNQGGA